MTNWEQMHSSGVNRERRSPQATVTVIGTTLLLCLALLVVAASGCGGTGGGGGATSSPGASASPDSGSKTSLTVGLFPWVPRPQQVEAAIRDAWQRRHPDVSLAFVFWDCYASDPPETLDVFVFDAVFLEHFRKRHLLHPLPRDLLGDTGDVMPVALEASEEGGRLWGVPQYLCSDVLLYRRGDRALEQADDVSDVVAALGTGTYARRRPPKGTGLLVDLSDPTAVSCLYVDAQQDDNGRYTPDPQLPWHADELDAEALGEVADLRRMASLSDARYVSNESFQRERWFGEGSGRAVISYTEGLAAMSARSRARVATKLLPLSSSGDDVPLLFVDLIAVNRSLRGRTPGKEALAEELAGLMGSTEVMLAALVPERDAGSPQYLLPARHSIYRVLARRYPLYAELYGLVTASEPRPSLVGAESRRRFRSMGPVIRQRVLAAH